MPFDKKGILLKYRGLSTGHVSDVMERLGIQSGVIHGLRPLSVSHSRFMGWAVTIKQVRVQSRSPENLTKHAEVIDELASEDDVIVIDAGGKPDVCTGGALLALRSKIRGIQGWVVDGSVRDANEIVELGFPVHCSGTSPVKSHLHLETAGINIPVEIRDIQIRPGDLIVADATGIVAVPAARAAEVLEAASELKALEEQVEKKLYKGMSFKEATTN